jgi:molybdate/tungstate transport system ATP-binding protein
MIELKNINKIWKEFQLKNVNLKLNKDYTILLGPSGAGKSIIIKCIAGILKPNSGKIYYKEEDITNMPPEKRNFGYVPQNYGLFPHMTVYKNINYGLKLKKFGKLEREKKIKDISEFLNIDKLLFRNPATLSGGEQQRVALARALVLNPKILLLDEPTSALDANNKENIINELKKIGELLPIIHITHDFVEAKTLGKNIVVVNNGRIMDYGDKEEVFNNPKQTKIAKFFGYNIIFDNKETYGVEPHNIIVEKYTKTINNNSNNNTNNKLIGEINGIYDFGHYKKLNISINDLKIKSIYYNNDLKIGDKVLISFKNKVVLKN